MNTLNGIENHISRLFNHLTQPFEWLFSLGLYSFHWAGYQSYIETLSLPLSLSLCKILNCALQGRRKVDDIFWGKEWLLVSVFTTFNPSKTSLNDKGSLTATDHSKIYKSFQCWTTTSGWCRCRQAWGRATRRCSSAWRPRARPVPPLPGSRTAS